MDFARDCDQLLAKCDEIIEADALSAFESIKETIND